PVSHQELRFELELLTRLGGLEIERGVARQTSWIGEPIDQLDRRRLEAQVPPRRGMEVEVRGPGEPIVNRVLDLDARGPLGSLAGVLLACLGRQPALDLEFPGGAQEGRVGVEEITPVGMRG